MKKGSCSAPPPPLPNPHCSQDPLPPWPGRSGALSYGNERAGGGERRSPARSLRLRLSLVPPTHHLHTPPLTPLRPPRTRAPAPAEWIPPLRAAGRGVLGTADKAAAAMGWGGGGEPGRARCGGPEGAPGKGLGVPSRLRGASLLPSPTHPQPRRDVRGAAWEEVSLSSCPSDRRRWGGGRGKAAWRGARGGLPARAEAGQVCGTWCGLAVRALGVAGGRTGPRLGWENPSCCPGFGL